MIIGAVLSTLLFKHSWNYLINDLMINKKNIEKCPSVLYFNLHFLEEKVVLSTVIVSPTILTLTYDEMLEREIFIKSIGETDVVKGRFNSIYSLSRKKYKERVNSTTFLEGGNNK